MATFPIQGGGGGIVETGLIVSTAATEADGGFDLLPCDDSVINSTTYPELTSIINGGTKITSQAKTFDNLGGTATNSNTYQRWNATSTDGEAYIIIFTSGTSLGQTVVQYTSDCYNTAGATAGGVENNFTPQFENALAACMSDDGSQAFAAFADTTAQMRAIYWNGSALASGSTFPADTISTSSNFDNVYCAMAGDGSIGLMLVRASNETNDISLGYDNTSPIGDAWTDVVKTGLSGNITPVGIAINGDGTKVYLWDRANGGGRVYQNTDVTTNSWTIQSDGQLPDNASGNQDRGSQIYTDTVGNTILFQPSGSSSLLFDNGSFDDGNTDTWYISTDQGVTFSPITDIDTKTDSYGNRIKIWMRHLRLERDNTLTYQIQRQDPDSVVTQEIVNTNDLSPTWIVDSYVPGDFNTEPAVIDFTIALNYNVPNDRYLSTARESTNTGFDLFANNVPSQFYTPFLSFSRIAAK